MNTDQSFIDPKHVIATRICNLRLQAGKTQDEMAEILGYDPGYYNSIECARRKLSFSAAEKLCRFHNVTFDYLYLGLPRPELMLLRDASPEVALTARDAIINLALSSSDAECECYWDLLKAARSLQSI